MKRAFQLLFLAVGALASLEIGVGIHDATGPIAGFLMMGMANPSQKGAGLHQRLFSRAFVAHDNETSKRFAFVSLDAGMGGIVLKNRVLVQLEARFPGVYTHDNVAISGTHTHSGQSGFLQDTLFQFSGSGFQPKVIDAFVTGVVESIAKAHSKLAPAAAAVVVGELEESNINRSPTAYLLNPLKEQAQYDHDTDLNMTLLKFTTAEGKPLGQFNWFAVHGTSLNNTNLLISGDNKGHASYLFEKSINGNTTITPPGQGQYVAAFVATNLGDVSPNTKGPHCRDTGLPCDNPHSTCNNRSQQCSGIGPGVDMYDSCRIIATKQFHKATQLLAAPSAPLQPQALRGYVDYRHSFVTMPGLKVSDSSGKPLGTLCKAAMGDSFAAGTTDGPGMFDFTQGANSSNPFWHIIASLLHKATPAEKACQAPKGILLATGSINEPWPWAPATVPVQLMRLGQLVIISVPTELTTMAGRRMRAAVKARLVKGGVLGEDAVVVIAGLSNGYADYTTTFEEYQQQRYEGASTIFGPHQLNAYIQELLKLADDMGAGKASEPGTPPEDFSHSLAWEASNYSTDHVPSGATHFGDVMTQPSTTYKPGQMASVTYAGAHALNTFRTQNSFLEVQRCTDAAATCSAYEVVAVDADWETRIHIKKGKKYLVETTYVWTVQWYIPPTAPNGHYRISYVGTSCDVPVFGSPKFNDFSGASNIFQVAA